MTNSLTDQTIVPNSNDANTPTTTPEITPTTSESTPKAKRMRPTVAQIRSEEFERGARYTQRQVIETIASMLGLTYIDDRDLSDLLETIQRKMNIARSAGFLRAVATFGAPEFVIEHLRRVAERDRDPSLQIEMLQLYLETKTECEAKVQAKQAEVHLTPIDTWPGHYLSHLAQTFTLTEDERRLCIDRKIEAIKSVRARTQLGLKEAKDVVDSYCLYLQTRTAK